MKPQWLNGSRWWVTSNYDSTHKFTISYFAKGASRMSKYDIVTFREDAPNSETYTTETGKAIPKFIAKALWESINQKG
jgi:hypothetical protein